MRLGKFIATSGIPASGKSSFAKELAGKEDAIIVSSDTIRKEIYGDVSCQDDPNRVFKLMKQRSNDVLRAGKSVIFDATNLSARKRAHIIKQEIKASSYEIYYMATPYDICLQRNKRRSRQVPDAVMEKMYKAIQIPFKSEGWDKVEYVHNYNHAFEDIKEIRNRRIEDNEIGRLVDMLHNTDCHDTLFKNNFPVTLSSEFAKAYNMPHDSSYHSFSISRHIFHVIDKVKDIENPIDREILLLSALYHDVGKPFCKSFCDFKGEKKRYASYIGHENVGAHVALCDLYALGADEELIVEVVELVQNHMRMMDASPKTLRKLQNSMTERQFNRLETLHLSDSVAK